MAVKHAPEVPPTERVLATYNQLSVAATGLNAASDELGKAIDALDAALQKLNLGVSAWTTLAGGDDGELWWSRDVGYTRIRDRWTIALRTQNGHHAVPTDNSEEVWSFGDAPRWMRVEAVGKIPELLEALLKRTEDTTKKIKSRIGLARELVAAIAPDTDDARDLWRERLHRAFTEAGMMFSADAIERSDVRLINNELVITTPEEYRLALPKTGEEIKAALQTLGFPNLRHKVVFVEQPETAQGQK